MQKSIEPNSRLKVRSYENYLDSPSDAARHRNQNSGSKRRRKSKRSSKKHRVYTGEPHALFSMLKGLVIIGLLTLGLFYGAKLPFDIPYEKFTKFFEPKTTIATSTDDQNNNLSTDNVTSTEQSAAVAKTETANDSPTGNLITSPEPVDQEPVDPEPADPQPTDTLTNVTPNPESESPEPSTTEVDTTVSEIEEIRIAKIGGNQSVSGDEVTPEPLETVDTLAIDSSIANPQQVSETPTTNTVEASSTDVQYTVKAYRATMFSDLNSADATETPVDRGAVVKALERSGDWVKIEIEDGGKIGYMHITHLSSN